MKSEAQRLEDKKRAEFKSVLKDLSTFRGKDCSDFSKRLSELYGSEGEFRHLYSDIFTVLTQIKQGDVEGGDIEILAQNLRRIKENLQVNSDKVAKSILKLYDHVSLDLARINYSEATFMNLSKAEELAKIKRQAKELRARINREEEQVDRLNDKVTKTQREYVAILGIFAAVVLSFMTGLSFSNSVLQNIDKASVYRISLCTLAIGFMLFNAIFILFYFLGCIVNKETVPNRWIVCIVNVCIIVAVVVLFLCWQNGFVEKRNDTINKLLQENTSCNLIFSA